MDFSILLKELNKRFQNSGLELQRQNADSNNIFNILNIQNNEVLICRFLGYLLDPSEEHRLGSVPLKTFLKRIDADADFTDRDYRAAEVKLEDHTKTNRRVDIAVYISDNEVIPIEVKLYASDQKAQLFDYYRYYNDISHKKVKKIYYLTLNGKKPSNESLCSLDKKERLNCEQYATISFKDTVQEWLDDLPLQNDCNNLITQFKEVITSMCREYDNNRELLELLSLDTEAKKPSEYLELLSVLLANKDFIWLEVRKQYLLEILKLGALEKEYVLTEYNEADNDKFSNCILTLKRKKDNKTVAWICVETNLYVETDHESPGWEADNEREGFFWCYLSPNGDKGKLQLKSPNESISRDDEIDLETVLLPVLRD